MSWNDDSPRSRFIELRAGQARDSSRNEGTVVVPLERVRARPEAPFEALFLAHYRGLRELARRRAQGAAVVAVHLASGELAGRLWLGQSEGAEGKPGVTAAIIGRHSECDLVLDSPDISLRHVALIVPPPGPLVSLRFSVHDLRSAAGLRGALGQRLGGAHVTGAGFFTLGEYALFCVATGAPGRWPELASEAWRFAAGQTQPLRIARPDERVADRSSWDATPRSRVSAIRGPLRTNAHLLQDRERRVCTLLIAAGGRRERLALGHAAVDRGILLGRYSRCDSRGIWEGDEISRVHLLVLRVEGQVYAFDTASTNGMHRDSNATEEARVINLSAGGVAVLGDRRGSVSLLR